jgi:hypothetical protein
MTILPPSVSRLSRQFGILNISQPYRPPRSVTGIALLYGDGVCFLCGNNWTVSTATSSQYLALNVRSRGVNVGLLARSQFASGRSCNRPTRLRFSVVFLRPRANAELIPKFHVALHASMQPSQW